MQARIAGVAVNGRMPQPPGACRLGTQRLLARCPRRKSGIMADTYGAERGLKRFEGFTDAVFAIALTLLIVEIKPPGSPVGPSVGGDLVQAMAAQWREHLALLLSFTGIGVYWLQHHYTGRIYAKSDHVFSVLNLGFLLAVMVLSYPLQIWCFNVGTPYERTASVALTIGLLAPSVFWLGKWLYALPDRRIVDERLTPDFLRQMTWRYGSVAAVNALAVPVALVAPRIGVGLSVAVLAFLLLPPPKPRYIEGEKPSEREIRAD